MHVCNSALYYVVTASTLLCVLGLIDVSKFYGKCEFKSVPSRPSTSFFATVVHFKIRNQLDDLGQIIIIFQLDKAINHVHH